MNDKEMVVHVDEFKDPQLDYYRTIMIRNRRNGWSVQRSASATLQLPEVNDDQFFDNAEKAVKEINRCRTAQDVAAMLRENHITGFTGEVNDCPLANYVRDQAGLSFSGPSQVTVTGYVVVQVGFRTMYTSQERRFRLSTQAQAFIHDFDDRKFPELINNHSSRGTHPPHKPKGGEIK